MTVDAVIHVSLGSFSLDVELNVADNEMIAVLGPNGAGKTTLLRTLSGLVAIDGGRIIIDGDVVDDPDAGRFVPAERRSVGVVFQEYLLFAHLSALDNVAFGLRERGHRKAGARAQARALLTEVAVEVNPSARPAQLSGGQAQRVALARALAIEPGLLLLDEPLAALDVQTRVATRRHLHDVLARVGGTRVLVTHDPIDALTLADRLLILENGRIAQQGTPNDVLSRPKTAYVAQLAGVNLYRGHGDGNLIHIGNDVLTAAGSHSGDVLAIIPPHAVVLHRHAPEGSARNVWQGTIIGMERFAGRVRIRVSGTIPVVAEVTPDAVSALGLLEGITVWAAVKATEIEVYPA